MVRSYSVKPTDAGFAVVSDQDGTVIDVAEEEWWADHVAAESFCDDEVMIRHENKSVD